jgi:thioredoxin-like negative regulator of GroEL
MLRVLTQVLTICVALASAAGAPTAAPKLAAGLPPSSVAHPYNESADARADAAQAIARAEASKKYVLLDFGGNWCPDCRALAGVLELEDVKRAVQRTFEVAMIDIGRRDKNLDIAARYGIDVRAVPLVIVLDPDGRFVNARNPTALSNAHDMSAQAIVDTIFGWLTPAP